MLIVKPKCEGFRIDSGVKQGCFMSPWPFNVYECNDESSENRNGEDGSEISGGGETVEIACPLVCK